MHPNYKQDESIIKNITHKYTSPTDWNKRSKLIKYKKKIKTVNVVVANNCAHLKTLLGRPNVVHLFLCSFGDWTPTVMIIKQ